MALEIERKYLVNNAIAQVIAHAPYLSVKQAYLLASAETTIRVRTIGNEAFITIKGITEGFSRPEFEYPIPMPDALQLLAMCKTGLIEKRRYTVEHDGNNWEIDVFEAQNEGLIVAEIELDSEAETFAMPQWIAEEVSGDKRYYNAYLAVNPYKSWL